MLELKTPGVYVEETSKFPPSVVPTESAFPAFIGYTEIGPLNEPTKISSLLQYENLFGFAKKEKIELQDTDKGLTLVAPKAKFLMYYSMQMYFANGGGECYVVSVGHYETAGNPTVIAVGNGTTENGLLKGLKLLPLEHNPAPTLIAFPDATSLTDQQKFYDINQAAIDQAELLKDRFVLVDTYLGNSTDKTTIGSDNLTTIQHFRNKIGKSNYGAAYFPHLKTVLNYSFDETVSIDHKGLQGATETSAHFFADEIADITALKVKAAAEIAEATPDTIVLANLLAEAIAIVEDANETIDVTTGTDAALVEAHAVLTAIENGVIDNFGPSHLALNVNHPMFDDEFEHLITALKNSKDLKGAADSKTLTTLKTIDSGLYNKVKNVLATSQVVLPPAVTMAGVYTKTDNAKGVWKAPANVGVNYVAALTEKVSDEEQKTLNVDTNGKSINAIRNFTGKGTLVWGARTLDGNSNEFRYIAVRRFFTQVETSLRHATEKFLFEPNTANTWLKVKAMAENYLFQQWTAGALAGSKPEEAYYVSIGLGKTMTAQEILEGKMIVEIGMAAVRPAEFIVLRFSHKLQES